MEFFLSLRIRLAGLPRIKCCLPAEERRMRPLPVDLNRFDAARLDFILGMLLSSLESSRASGARGLRAENALISAPPTRVKQSGDTQPLRVANHSRHLRPTPRKPNPRPARTTGPFRATLRGMSSHPPGRTLLIMLSAALACALLAAAALASAHGAAADVYQWTDQQGVVRYTPDPSRIPAWRTGCRIYHPKA